MMKKIFIFAIVAFGMLACSEKNAPEDEDNKGGSTNPKEISCDPYLIEVDASQHVTKTITLTATDAWSATTNVDWITIETKSGQGSAFVNLAISAGPQAEGRVIFSTNRASSQVIVRRIDKYPGSFSVSATKKVYFSLGNLQYNASSKTWRFAKHQYDIIGKNNENVSSNYDGWIDLFGWGASGYNGVNPSTYTLIDGNGFTNYIYCHYNGDSDIAGTKYDWGVYCAISNGGNLAGLWRTLTKNEWQYVLSSRPNAEKLSGAANINNIDGIILLPDGWKTPNEIVFSSSKYSYKEYSISEWQLMEASGAIFLPDAGFACTGSTTHGSAAYHYHTIEYSTAGRGNYWTSSKGSSIYSATGIDGFNIKDWYREYAYSVRLVKDVE